MMACLGPATIPHGNKPIRIGWPLRISTLPRARRDHTPPVLSLVPVPPRPAHGWLSTLAWPPGSHRTRGATREQAASASRAALPAEARRPELPGPRIPRAGSPGWCPFPTPRRLPTPSQSRASPAQVLPGCGHGLAWQRGPERERCFARLTTAQTPRRGLSEWRG